MGWAPIVLHRFDDVDLTDNHIIFRLHQMLTTTTREIKNLKLLDHENIVPLLEMVVQRKSGMFGRLRSISVGISEAERVQRMIRGHRSRHIPCLPIHGA